MIHVEGATWTAFAPNRTQHKVIDDQLVLATEEIGECFLTAGGIEDIVLLQFLPMEADGVLPRLHLFRA